MGVLIRDDILNEVVDSDVEDVMWSRCTVPRMKRRGCYWQCVISLQNHQVAGELQKRSYSYWQSK